MDGVNVLGCFNSFLKIYFYLCMRRAVCTCEIAVACGGQKRALNTLELDLTIVSHPVWVL